MSGSLLSKTCVLFDLLAVSIMSGDQVADPQCELLEEDVQDESKGSEKCESSKHSWPVFLACERLNLLMVDCHMMEALASCSNIGP